MAATEETASEDRGLEHPPLPSSPQTPHLPLSDVLANDPAPGLSPRAGEQNDRPDPPIAFSQCEYTERSLCINRRPGHVGTRSHVAHLSDWLAFRGVINVRDLVRRYGVPAVQDVAAELDTAEAGGVDWREGVHRPGALIHWMVKNRAG